MIIILTLNFGLSAFDLPEPQISEFNLIFDWHFPNIDMKQKDVFKKIGGILQELSEQYEYLETVSDNLNDLELELLLPMLIF